MINGSQKCITLLNFGEVITQFTNRHWKALLTLIMAISLFLSLYAFNPSPATWGDNAEFVILSQSISKGKGFKLINFPTPIPNKRYPPGFPLLLMPITFLFGTDIVLLKTIIVITFIVSIIGIFLILRQLVTTWIAFFVTLVILSNFTLLNFSCQLMAEIPYLCFSVLSLWFYFFYKKKEPGRMKKILFLCFTICSLYAFYIKSVGIALLVAIWISLILEKKYREAFLYAVLCIALYLPWLVRNQVVGGDTYIKQFLVVNPYDPSLGKLDWVHLGMRVKHNFLRYLQYHLPFILLPSLAVKKIEYNTHILFFLNVIFFLLFFILEWLRKRYVIVLYLVFSLFILFVWPPVWTIPRMLIPIVPFIFVIYGVIINDVLTVIKNKHVIGISMLILCIGFLLYSTMHWKYAKEQEYGFKNRFFVTYYELCTWIKNNVEDDAVINARKPYLAFLISGKKTTRYSSKNPDQFYRLLKKNKVTHIIVGNLKVPGQEDYFTMISKKRDKFLVLHKTRKPTHYLFKVLN